MRNSFPFTAILGLDLAKTSLLLHAVDPRLGGVLLSGHRGCAKTTLARAFGQLMDGIVEVPLGASDDRLLGSVNVESVLERNEWRHAVGLLEQAHEKILYVDEINLLSDALSDLMLDAAATGTYRLEREGFSREIESRFVMIGSMNPDEGELRPQLADRFAHAVDVRNGLSAEDRAEVIRRRIDFDFDAVEFGKRFEKDETNLRDRIQSARASVAGIALTDSVLGQINERAAQLDLEGMRTELAVARTARAAAAWNGRNEIAEEDITLAWELCLPHRNDEEPPSPPEDSKPPEPKDKPSPRSFSSLQPKTAEAKTIQLERKIEASPEIQAWWADQPTATTLAGISHRRNAEIHWRETVLGWCLRGKEAGLRFHQRVSREENWFFLDASRSAGTSGLLNRVLPALDACLTAGNATKSQNHVLILTQGKLEWLTRRANANLAKQKLAKVEEAGGESPLLSGLQQLTRAIIRRKATGSRVVIVSDGISTLLPGETAASKVTQLRQAVARLQRLGMRVLWVTPPAKRGLALNFT